MTKKKMVLPPLAFKGSSELGNGGGNDLPLKYGNLYFLPAK